MPTTETNNRVPRATRKTRDAWMKQQKDLYRLRRLRIEKELYLTEIKAQKDMIRLMPLSANDKRKTLEQIEVLKFDLLTISHDIDYYSGY